MLRGEDEQAPNFCGVSGVDKNRVSNKVDFCGACELVLHPKCSALWHTLVFMGVDVFLKTPCWYCQDMVRDCWEPQFPAVRPPGAKPRKEKSEKRARTEEAPPVQEEDNSEEEDQNEGGGGKEMIL